MSSVTAHKGPYNVDSDAASAPSHSGTANPPDALFEVVINNNASAPSSIDDGDNIFPEVMKKSIMQQSGREKGAFAYGTEEHLTLLSFINLTPIHLTSETSPEWRAVHAKMVEVYQGMGVSPWQSTTLNSHFVELYRALKQGIRALSLHDRSPKCPTWLAKGVE
jgi:hypothetical protein